MGEAVEEAEWLFSIRMQRDLISLKSVPLVGLRELIRVVRVEELERCIYGGREGKRGSWCWITAVWLLQVKARLFLPFPLPPC